ncbi:hypothetical protein ABZ897_41265 [Nonomuraea sp. NPDC046802]|uniref:hypothetical protein n=1 Tax=Nonomuraea sp. NPDC046802 TaxID=3154919 RepID=UPI0033E0989F
MSEIDAAGRKEVVTRLPSYLARHSSADSLERRPLLDRHGSAGSPEHRSPRRERLVPLLLAGVGCLSGASAVTAWMFRREFQRISSDDRILELLRSRPEPWRANVARRIVTRLRLPDLRHWGVAAALVRETGIEPPDSDLFVVGWLRALEPLTAGRDPLLGVLGPRIFAVDALAEALPYQVGTVVRLVEDGLLDRAAVIDGVLRRLLRDGPNALTALVTLHDRLDLDIDESAARAGDYAGMLAAGPVAVADMALTQVRRLEEAGLLAEWLFAEAMGALAFRPEKKLLRAAISWAGDAVLREASRVDGVLRAMSPIFTQDTPALQERAVRLAVKLAPQAGEPGREAVRQAAQGLAADLREEISVAYGVGIVAAAEPVAPLPSAGDGPWLPSLAATLPSAGDGPWLPSPVAPLPAAGDGPWLPSPVAPLPAAGDGPWLPSPVATLPSAGDGPSLPPPVGSPEELAHEIALFGWPPDVYTFERLLAGLAEWSHRAPEALREALRRPGWQPFDPNVFGHGSREVHEGIIEGVRRAFLAFFAPGDSSTLTGEATSKRHRQTGYAAFDRLYLRRALELVAPFEAGSGYPVLLATPTSGTGHLDPGVLLDRLERLEAAGVEALPADLAQALLRLPRAFSDADVRRAKSLRSRAGLRCAAWMRGGGLADPEVAVSVRGNAGQGFHGLEATLTLRPGAAEPPDFVAELLATQSGHSYTLTWWPLVMPSHREIVSAHLACYLPHSMEALDRQTQALAGLAHGDGPLGEGAAYALVCGMGHMNAGDRAAATDALLMLAARGQVPVAALGEAVSTLVSADVVKLNRVVAVLDDATQAGAHEAVWAVIVGALPGLLPKDGESPRAGSADLLAAGARAARIAGARAELPEVAAIAARKGSSRLVQEARRLCRLVLIES